MRARKKARSRCDHRGLDGLLEHEFLLRYFVLVGVVRGEESTTPMKVKHLESRGLNPRKDSDVLMSLGGGKHTVVWGSWAPDVPPQAEAEKREVSKQRDMSQCPRDSPWNRLPNSAKSQDCPHQSLQRMVHRIPRCEDVGEVACVVIRGSGLPISAINSEQRNARLCFETVFAQGDDAPSWLLLAFAAGSMSFHDTIFAHC